MTDIQNKILRHIGPAFAEDPLRVLRGMQFASRFGFKATAETLELCRTISSTYPSLSKDRVWKEWTKWAAKAVQPSKGLQFLQASGWMQHFPQIQGLIGVPQNPKHHPEGDTWQHTLNVCDALARDPGWKNQPEDERAQLMLAALCHDFGKVTHTQITEAGITSYGHDEAGVEPTIAFLQEIGVPKTWEENISKLVRYHMSRIHQHTSRSVRRLAKKLEPARLDDLFLIMTADHNGRGASKLNPSSNVEKMRELAQACQVTNKPEKPILMGRHLLERGMQPGPEIGRLTQQAFEAQLNEEFNDIKGALAWLDQQAVVPTA